jgi:NADPH2:quinone reductase
MKAVEISAPGAPEVLRLVDRPDAQAGAGEVLIRVAASGVNRPDVLQRTGNYPVPPGASDIPGLEVAGEIIAGDSRAMAERGLTLGQRVCALVAGGGYAQLCAAPVGQCLPVPRGWSDIQAASLPETFFTVWSNVFDRCKLQVGETLLVQGGSSGIGVTAIQMAKVAGARVIVTVGSAEKAKACVDLGADHAIVYKTQDFSAEVMRLTDGHGANVILDMVGGAYVPREIDCLADDGRLALIALQGGAKTEINLGPILRRRLTLTGSTLRPRSIAFKTAIAQSLQSQVWPHLDTGRIVPVIHSTFEAADAVRAHALMESNQHIGKIVLTW